MSRGDLQPASAARWRGGAVASGTTKPCGGDRDRDVVSPPPLERPVAGRGVGGRLQRRSALYDSFELNAMVVRLNRLLASGEDGGGAGGGGGAAGRARRVGSWVAAVPKTVLRMVKRALRGPGRQGDG